MTGRRGEQAILESLAGSEGIVQRVPVEESRRFAQACSRAGRSCTYVEFEGQGHGLKGLRNQVRVYREMFAFFERLPGGV